MAAGQGRLQHHIVQKMKAGERAAAAGLPLSCFLFCSSGFSPGPAQGPRGLLGWDNPPAGTPVGRGTHPQGHHRREWDTTGTGTPPGQGQHRDRDTTGMGTPPGAPGREPGGCCLPGWWGARAALQDPRGLGGSPLGAAALGLSEGPVPMPQAGLAPRGAPHRLGGCSLPGKAAVLPEPGGCGVTFMGCFCTRWPPLSLMVNSPTRARPRLSLLQHSEAPPEASPTPVPTEPEVPWA